ncbi:phospholipid phosphatase-related protein type 3 isoform X2 [Hippocampus zosterae]|uniref:phospholipid phosphatase-related protein type 3 isoform X2 n=1 Tax=Hippocampus zosterae TaxID=109293 RepID=UPI00223D6D55|nr:phospholipid phosphatase-related protein type 3 isoform X2 [Hippocampus zosterae]
MARREFPLPRNPFARPLRARSHARVPLRCAGACIFLCTTTADKTDGDRPGGSFRFFCLLAFKVKVRRLIRRMMMMRSSPSDKMKRKWTKDSVTLLPCFYFVELPIAASSMVSLYFLELTDVLRPPRLGFRCHDRDLSKPYVDGGQEMIPLLMLLSLAFAGPAASIMLVEAFVYLLQSRTKAEGSVNAGGCNFNSFLRRTVRFVGVHVFGLCATALVTDVIQLSTGYHAPFFLTVCKPNYSHVSCDANAYVTKDICSGHDQQAIAAARKTFPSRHATLSAFAAVYVSMYFNSAVWDGAKLLKPVLVLAFAIAAALSGLTQITQHRSHPVDVYVGFAVGAFIAAYLAFHAAANFKSSDVPPAAPSPPSPEDPLRALTERGHQSVYNKGPASASESNDEIASTPGPPAESPKRAGADAELAAPRGPTAKETMLTFGNALPRSGVADGDGTPAPVQPRPTALGVPSDPVSSRRLVSEWKRGSAEMRLQSARDEMERADSGSEAGVRDRGSPALVRHPCKPTPTPPAGAAAPPRPPQIPQAGPPPVSPKTSSARAKWLAIREKSGAEASGRLAAGQPRPVQVVAASQRRDLPPSPSSAEKSPESASACRGSSSAAPWSPRRGPPAEKRHEAVVTVDARASRHPPTRSPPSPWEWAGPDPRDAYRPRSPRAGDSSFRPERAAAGASGPSPPRTQLEVLTDAQREEMASRRKTAPVLLEQDAHLTNENHLRSFRGRSMKE